MMLRLPNLELLEYKAKQYFMAIEENMRLYEKETNKIGMTRMSSMIDFFEVEMFAQTWGSTCLGFDVDIEGNAMIGGDAMTTAYTTVFFEPITTIYIVFFGNNACYQVQNANEKFLNDLKNHQLEPLSKAKIYY